MSNPLNVNATQIGNEFLRTAGWVNIAIGLARRNMTCRLVEPLRLQCRLADCPVPYVVCLHPLAQAPNTPPARSLFFLITSTYCHYVSRSHSPQGSSF